MPLRKILRTTYYDMYVNKVVCMYYYTYYTYYYTYSFINHTNN